MAEDKDVSLGITPVEDKQIAALSEGASPEDVASLSKQSVETIPKEVKTQMDELELETLLGQDDLSLEDLSDPLLQRRSISNKASNSNLAAYVAVMSDEPEEVAAVYQQSSLTLEDNPSPDAVKSIVRLAKERQMGKAKAALIDFISDPNYSDEEKGAAAKQLLDIETEQYNIRNSLSAESLEADSEGEGQESEFVRVSFADAIVEVNAVKREQQKILNREAAKGDVNLGKAYADIFTAFIPFVEQSFTSDVIEAMSNGEGWAQDMAWAALGSSKKSLRDMVSAIPPADRIAFTEKLASAIENHSGNVLMDENDYLESELMRTILEDGYYTDVDVWIDNAVSVLDLIGLGSVAGDAGRFVKGKLGLSKSRELMASDWGRMNFRSKVQSTSVSQNVKDTNPTQARLFHEAAVADTTDEVASATYGTTHTEAAANDILPEIGLESGRVRNKVSNPDLIKRIREASDSEVMGFADNRGALEYYPQEKAALRAKFLNDLEQVEGMRPRHEMNQIEALPDGVRVKYVYGPNKSGYSTPQEAVDMALWSLRDYGVTADDITLLVREGDSYVPTTLTEVQGREAIKGEGFRLDAPERQPDYLIQLETTHKFNPSNVTDWVDAEVKNNPFDRLPVVLGRTGSPSLQRMLVDPASSLDPRFFYSFSRAVDKSAEVEKRLLDMGNKFAVEFNKLPIERKNILDQKIKEANHDGKDFDYTNMVAEGLSREEIDVLKSWRDYWDTAYYFENKDLAKTLSSQGYGEFIDVANDTILIAKKVKAKGGVKVGSLVYDHTNDSIRPLTKTERDTIYDTGGVVAQLRQPIRIGDEAAEFVVSSEKPGGTYIRALNENSQVLNYRKGYYTVTYTDPYIIDAVHLDRNGNELYRAAVATADGIKDADTYMRRMQANSDGSVVYQRRRNSRDVREDPDVGWDLNHAAGRTAQKVRGERLQDATSNLSDMTQAPILGPVDSLIVSARSLSDRVAMRDVLQVQKARFISNFSDYLPENKFGEKVMPANISEVKYRGTGQPSSKRLADARTSFEYLNYIENGYANMLDDGVKALLRFGAETFGKGGAKSLEKLLNTTAEGRGITGTSKGLAFNAYLATNPARQFIVQGHQAAQLAANFPRFMTSGQMTAEVLAITFKQLGKGMTEKQLNLFGMTSKQADEIFKQWRDSGLASAIDKQNLIRGSLSDMADQLTTSKFDYIPGASSAKKATDKSLSFLRKIGFDAGENFNMMTSWLAHRDEAIRAGKDMNNLEVADEVVAKARNYTYNMNSAGDMPYNQNSLGVLFQFMQVPHKALLTLTTNRGLSKKSKAKLTGFNAVMYTLPPATMLALFGDYLPDEGLGRDLALNGLEGAMFNKVLSLMSGEETYIDWSGLSPIDMFGTMDFIHSLFTSDLGTIVASTPAGALFFGSNPRLSEFAKVTARFTNLVDDYEDPTEFSDVAMTFANISSGWSNAMKAAYMMKYKQKLSSTGGIVDPEVTSAEALMQTFGFQTLDSAESYWRGNKQYEASQALKKDVTEWYKSLKKHMLRKGATSQELDFMLKVHSEAWRVWGNDNATAKDILDGLIKRDLANKDVALYNQVLRMTDMMSSSQAKASIEASPDIPRERKDSLKSIIDDIETYKDQNPMKDGDSFKPRGSK